MTRLPSWLLTVRPAAVALTVLVAAAAAATKMVPYEYRPYNFAAVGAVALFAGGRLGLLPACLAVLLSMGVADLYLARTMQGGLGYDDLPWLTYGVYFAYAGLGWLFLRRTESPLRIGAVTLAASLLFFLVTNFHSWLRQDLPYGYSLGGLFDCYAMALPFFHGTLLSDLGFTAGLFAVHAVLVRSLFPAERVARSDAAA